MARPDDTQPKDPTPEDLDPAADVTDSGRDAAHPEPPHPAFARSPEEYTDPPGHHRRSDGTATDVGA